MFLFRFVRPQGRGQKHFRLLPREQHRTRQQGHQLKESGRERKGRRGSVALMNKIILSTPEFTVLYCCRTLPSSFLSFCPCEEIRFSHTDKHQRSLEVPSTRSSHFYSYIIVTNWPVLFLSALQSWKWGTSWLTIRSGQMAAFVNPPLFVSWCSSTQGSLEGTSEFWKLVPLRV